MWYEGISHICKGVAQNYLNLIATVQ